MAHESCGALLQDVLRITQHALRHTQEELQEVVEEAMAGGPNTSQACRALQQQLSTSEVRTVHSQLTAIAMGPCHHRCCGGSWPQHGRPNR